MDRTVNMLKSKIHGATVTGADPDYEGSVSIDADLMRAAEILPFEAVHVWNVTQGTRLMTYAIPAEPGSGIVCLNGAAALLNNPGDKVILATFQEVNIHHAKNHSIVVVKVDSTNSITSREEVSSDFVKTENPSRPVMFYVSRKIIDKKVPQWDLY